MFRTILHLKGMLSPSGVTLLCCYAGYVVYLLVKRHCLLYACRWVMHSRGLLAWRDIRVYQTYKVFVLYWIRVYFDLTIAIRSILEKILIWLVLLWYRRFSDEVALLDKVALFTFRLSIVNPSDPSSFSTPHLMWGGNDFHHTRVTLWIILWDY